MSGIRTSEMVLQLFAFHEFPNAFAVTKIDAALEDCSFLLDFSRPLERFRWLGIVNKWIGPTIVLMVPVVHYAEQNGDFIIGVRRSDPYFMDLQRIWRKHFRSQTGFGRKSADGLDGLVIAADFSRHFPEDCR